MRGKAFGLGAVTAAAVALLGCHHDKQNVGYTPKEQVVLPSDEPRFNNPPAAEYRKRPESKSEKSLIGNKMAAGPGF